MNTKTQTFQMHLYVDKDDGTFQLHKYQPGDSCKWLIYVGTRDVECEVPESFDLRAAQLSAKQEELQKVRAEFTARITQIQREINELQAIELADAIPAKEAA